MNCFLISFNRKTLIADHKWILMMPKYKHLFHALSDFFAMLVIIPIISWLRASVVNLTANRTLQNAVIAMEIDKKGAGRPQPQQSEEKEMRK